VCIDTVRRDEWDAVWTHEGFATIEFPHWGVEFDRAFEATTPEEKSIEVRGIDGVVRTISHAKIDQTFHRFYVDALLAARAAGVFEPLPKAPRCELEVVNNDCGFSWPEYDDAGLENMADPAGTRLSPERPRTPAERLAGDDTAYDVWLADPAGKPAIAAVNAAYGCGLLAAKQIAQSGTPVARDVKATEVARLARLFRDRGPSIRIDPPFRHAID
jgi:hypothetical protein